MGLKHCMLPKVPQKLPPASEDRPDPQVSIKMSDVVCTARLGGLLKSYSHRAALTLRYRVIPRLVPLQSTKPQPRPIRFRPTASAWP